MNTNRDNLFWLCAARQCGARLGRVWRCKASRLVHARTVNFSRQRKPRSGKARSGITSSPRTGYKFILARCGRARLCMARQSRAGHYVWPTHGLFILARLGSAWLGSLGRGRTLRQGHARPNISTNGESKKQPLRLKR